MHTAPYSRFLLSNPRQPLFKPLAGCGSKNVTLFFGIRNTWFYLGVAMGEAVVKYSSSLADQCPLLWRSVSWNLVATVEKGNVNDKDHMVLKVRNCEDMRNTPTNFLQTSSIKKLRRANKLKPHPYISRLRDLEQTRHQQTPQSRSTHLSPHSCV